MNLCIDVGNTRLKHLVFDQDKEVWYTTSTDFDLDVLGTIFKEHFIKNVIISSTRIIDETWLNFIESRAKCYNLANSEVKIPITIQYETPETLGKDRIAAATGASYLYPGQFCIVINAGTCLTCDAINAKSTFLGGNISPGIKMRLKAMHAFTDKLPLVEMQYNNQLFGSSTVKALQNGAVQGAIYEVESFLQTVISTEEKVNILISGGDANIFVKHLKFKIFAVPNLVLLGLNKILRFNADQ